MKTFAVMMLVAGSLVAGPVKWENNLEAAQARARAEHKLIFCDLWTGWCGWCIKLQKDTFPSREGEEALSKVVALSVQTQTRAGEPTPYKHLEARYRVEAFPTLLILDAEGHEVARHAGYFPPREFKEWVNGVVAGRK